RHPGQLRVGRNDRTEQRLGALDVDGEVVIHKKHANLATLALGARFQAPQFVDDALIGTKANRIPEKAGHGAEFTAIGATAPRFHGNHSEGAPPGPHALKHWPQPRRNEIELVEVERLPGNGRIRLETRLALLAYFIYGRINFLEFTAGGVLDYF